MSDKAIRELIEYCKNNPEDENATARLATIKARTGLGLKTFFTITNPKGKHYYHVKETSKWNEEYTHKTQGVKATFSETGKEFDSIEQVYLALNTVVEKGVVEQIADCSIIKHVLVEVDAGPVINSLQVAIEQNLNKKKNDLEKRLQNLENERTNQLAAIAKTHEDKRKETLKEIEKVKRKLSKEES